ncbi:MAG: methyl-accepting chemotaxis protein, partial [Actinomycetota bacterium]|nr:methyl-accepting chemotaxis protein [Actinomycetota bacterium]
LGLLSVSVPVLALLVVVLTQSAGEQIASVTKTLVANRATAVAGSVETYLGERRLDIQIVASSTSGEEQRHLGPMLAEYSRINEAYDAFTIVRPDGTVVAASDPGSTRFGQTDQAWFRSAVAGQQTFSPVFEADGQLQWYAAQPVDGGSGRSGNVILGKLSVARLSTLLAAVNFGRTAEVMVVDADRRLILSSRAGKPTSDDQLLASGTLRTQVATQAVRNALGGDAGAIEDEDHRGRAVFAGFAGVPAHGFAIVAKKDRSEALDPVERQRRLGLTLGLVAAGLLIAFGYLFARRESKHLRGTVGQLRAVGEQIGTNANDLSSASEELAATTAQQSAAVAQTSATMEELARTSGVIADTVGRVAGQLVATRDNVERAQNDVDATSQRALALSERVNDISAILVLINEIADQTSLLALNAAIEAARAGESGRGFAVVADEVRRLAERSKGSASEIATIVQAAQAENTATVLAMEKGARQLGESLQLIEDVATGGDQVRLTTHQQRLATEQVVKSMGQMSTGSQQVSSTAQQIASSAASMTAAARDLNRTATETTERF